MKPLPSEKPILRRAQLVQALARLLVEDARKPQLTEPSDSSPRGHARTVVGRLHAGAP